MALQSICRFFFIYACFVLAQGAPFCSLKDGECYGERRTFVKRHGMNIFHGENKSIPLVPDGAVLVDIDGDNDDDIMYLASNSSSSTLFILTQLENTGNSSDAVFSNSERHFFGWKKEGVPEGA